MRVAVDIGFAKSLVLSTFARLTVALESPPTVPASVGLLIGAFRSRAFGVALDIGFATSLD